MEEKKVITYEYRTLRVSRTMEAMWTDAYENLGWQVTNVSLSNPALSSVEINLKRDRKIKNKEKLIALQEKINLCLQRIERLNQAKKNAGQVEGLTTGVAASLTLGGGLSLIMTVGGVVGIACGTVLGVIGVGVGILAYYIYKKQREKKLKKLDPQLEAEFDKLSELCEEANGLC